MERYFFTSHTAGEDEPWVARFHADLERRLSVEVGRPVRGLIDGQRRSAELDQGAATLPCMLAIVSDRYFRDARCGRDWAVFAARIRLDEARRPGEATGCLIPVVWREPGDVPLGIDLPAPPAGGLYQCMRLRRNHGDDGYVGFVVATAGRILAARERRLPPWSDASVDVIEPAFGTHAHPVSSP